jgi:hypothetical protein
MSSYAHAGFYTSGLLALPGTVWQVYLTGTRTPATLYDDADMDNEAGSTVGALNGSISFYAQPGLYDILCIDGSPNNIPPLTVSVPINPLDAGGGGGSPLPVVLVASDTDLPTTSAYVVVFSDVTATLPLGTDALSEPPVYFIQGGAAFTLQASGSDLIDGIGDAASSVDVPTGTWACFFLIEEDGIGLWQILPLVDLSDLPSEPFTASTQTEDFNTNVAGSGNVIFDCDATAGDITASSSEESSGQVLVFVKTDATGHTVVLPECFPNFVPVLTLRYQTVTIAQAGVGWVLISEGGLPPAANAPTLGSIGDGVYGIANESGMTQIVSGYIDVSAAAGGTVAMGVGVGTDSPPTFPIAPPLEGAQAVPFSARVPSGATLIFAPTSDDVVLAGTAIAVAT